MILTLIQAFIFCLYIVFIVCKFGILKSISDSWYELKTEKLEFLFTLFCWIIGFLMAAQSSTLPFFFFSGAGLCFVGVATSFKLQKSIEKTIHNVGAIICIISALCGLLIENYIWFPMMIFVISYIIIELLNMKNKIWWIEIISFISILSGLLVKYF